MRILSQVKSSQREVYLSDISRRRVFYKITLHVTGNTKRQWERGRYKLSSSSSKKMSLQLSFE